MELIGEYTFVKPYIYKNKTHLNYWWVHENESIIIKSKNKNYPEIAILPCNSESIDLKIRIAERVIADLAAGRQTEKEAFEKLS